MDCFASLAMTVSDQMSGDREQGNQMSGNREQGTEKARALRAGGEGKTPRPNFPAPAEAGGNFLCSLSPDI
jgi:hypothetical protein